MALSPEKLAEIRAKAAAALAGKTTAAPAPPPETSVKEEMREVHGQDMLINTAADGVTEITLLEIDSSEKPSAVTPGAPTPLSNAEQICQRIADLQLSLQTASPNYERLLHDIHVALHKDEDVVHILTEEQIGVICAALGKKKGIVLATAAPKGKTASGKPLKAISLDDI